MLLLPSLTLEDIRTVSPALERYTQGALLGDVWKRPGLAPRDRSVITLAALIARNQTVEMGHHVNLALDNGVKPGEISEIITHLAFYCGWSNALSAVALAKDVFVKRGIGADQLPPDSDELLPLDEAAEAQRAAAVEQLVGSSVPGIVKYTTEVLFHDSCRNNAKINVVTRRWREHFPTPPSPSLPRFAILNRAGDLFPLFCSWLSLH